MQKCAKISGGGFVLNVDFNYESASTFKTIFSTAS